ncbi:hypothetical protein [Methanofollis tationis]|uniref:Uncharacterized protein n=1 Tax=Methanofollis tationis TaxID=81417 RepID=A0A7K4HL46_9EURY|nr:hypothetical protein [Methanofollis tationis]NVO65996.1 hypothetical protein [Methanofollis tationis]
MGSTMVLEETLTLNDIDDAEDLVRTLRGAGMTARLSRTTRLDRSLVLTGRVRDFRSLFSGEIVQVADPGLKEGYKHTLADIEKTVESVAAFMAEHPPGVPFPDDAGQDLIRPVMEALEKDGAGETIPDETAEQFVHWIRALALLQSNGLIEIREDGEMALQRHADPDDLVMSLPFALVYEAEPESLGTYGIRVMMTIASVPLCRVTFGADAIAGMDIGEVDALIADLEIDEEEYDAFMERLSVKMIVVERVLECIEERGTATAMEIYEMMKGEPLTTGEGEITLKLDLDYLRDLLADLFKARVVRRSGAAFRIAS